MPFNTETTDEVGTQVSQTVYHNSEVLDIATINLTAAGHENVARGGYSSSKTQEEETKHLKAHNQQLHHTEEAIMEVEEIHLDKQENYVQPVENQLTI
jgi:hypothetical protein